ncbi:MAG TPA: flagellar assembly protein H, partial [Rikenellaceae bacterium]|nr:flagellar assembly protein H [Rikenellaceae bacterium]
KMNERDILAQRVFAERKGFEAGYADGEAKGLADGTAKGMAEGMTKGMAEGMAKGMAKGMAEGMAKGMAEGMAKVAKSLLALGMPVEQIVNVTGLTAEQILALK